MASRPKRRDDRDGGFGGGSRGGYGSRDGGSSGGYGGGGDKVVSDNQIYVTGLPTNLTEEDIASFFGSIGVIKNDKRTGKPKIWIYKNRDT